MVEQHVLECDVLMLKPVHPHQLAATVAAALSGPPPQAAGALTTKGELRHMTQSNTEPVHVLVVEDERDYAELLAAYLRDDGFEVRVATDGVDGLAKLREQRPDVISLDLQMPNKGGVQLYRELRSDPSLCEIPVVVVTGVARDHPELGAFVRSFLQTEHLPMPDAYLEKPVAPGQFLPAVRNALREPGPAA